VAIKNHGLEEEGSRTRRSEKESRAGQLECLKIATSREERRKMCEAKGTLKKKNDSKMAETNPWKVTSTNRKGEPKESSKKQGGVSLRGSVKGNQGGEKRE